LIHNAAIVVLFPKAPIDEIQCLAPGVGDLAVMDPIRGPQGPKQGLERGAAYQLYRRGAHGKVLDGLDI